MKILSFEVPVREIVSKIKIQWTRGDFTINSREVYEIAPNRQKAEVSEMFVKLSAFYRNPANGKYQSKGLTIAISGFTDGKDPKPKPKFLGKIDIDLGQYVGMPYQKYSFVLHQSLPNSSIELELMIAPFVEGQPLAEYLPPGTIPNRTSLEERKEEED